MAKFNYSDVLVRPYKNAEIEIVVEDDAITTGKVFLDNQCVNSDFFTDENGNDIPYTRDNYEKVFGLMKMFVDKMWEDNFALATANR